MADETLTREAFKDKVEELGYELSAYSGDGPTLEAELLAHDAALRARAEKAERERDEAIAHDRQPYPTAAAYEAVCAARSKYAARAAALENALREIAVGKLPEDKTSDGWLCAARFWRIAAAALREGAKPSPPCRTCQLGIVCPDHTANHAAPAAQPKEGI